MCGIAGFIGKGDKSDLFAMTNSLSHRGPDGEGFFVESQTRVFLGHKRLSIVDIEHGTQPMWSSDGSVGVIFNGEIYNQKELRRHLEKKGYKFNSLNSDTEVLLYGFMEWDTSLFQKLNGMFGLAIYCKDSGRLVLARDRFGEKPLFFYHENSLFIFASELSAIKHHKHADLSTSQIAIQKYFAHGFIPGPSSLYEKVKKLRAGHFLVYELNENKIFEKPYYEFTIFADEKLYYANEDELAEELEALIIQSVQRRLMSDVPLGYFLSGGMDSSAVVAAASKRCEPSKMNTFSIGFQHKTFDESGHAQMVANEFSTNHTLKYFDLKKNITDYENVMSRMDEPIADPSLLPTFDLCRLAKQRVKVALTGDGADELFAGYDPFLALSPSRIYDHSIPRFLHSFARGLVNRLPVSESYMSLDFKIKKTLEGLSYPFKVRNPIWLSLLEPKDIKDAICGPVDCREVYSEAIELWEKDSNKNIVDKTLEFYTRFYLTDNILVKSDRAAMMNSIETRAVFLDNDVASFAQSLPFQLKLNGRNRKYILKKALARMLPKQVIQRKKKGFGVPVNNLFRNQNIISSIENKTLVQDEFLESKAKEHQSGIRDNRMFLFGWLALNSIK